MREANVDSSRAFPMTGTAPDGTLLSEPGRTSTCTSRPRATSAAMTGRPMYPVPPRTKTGFSLGSTRDMSLMFWSASLAEVFDLSQVRLQMPHGVFDQKAHRYRLVRADSARHRHGAVRDVANHVVEVSVSGGTLSRAQRFRAGCGYHDPAFAFQSPRVRTTCTTALMAC